MKPLSRFHPAVFRRQMVTHATRLPVGKLSPSIRWDRVLIAFVAVVFTFAMFVALFLS